MCPLDRPARGDYLRRAPPLLDQDQPAQIDRPHNHVGDRKIYVSAVQAPYIKAIDSCMLPRCAIEKKRH